MWKPNGQDLSVHDSRIFRESHLCTLFERGKDNINVVLTVLHTLIVGLTELHCIIVQVITMGSWLETGAMPVGSIL